MLSRPDVHNAFNATMIAELTRALQALDRDATVRAVVLLGDGKSFCAGADLNWMREMAGYGAVENLADANALATMLKTLDRLSKPTIARVHGSAFGGGAGLVACCDIAFAAQDATFSFSEAKLGLIPATIAPMSSRRSARGTRGAISSPRNASPRRKPSGSDWSTTSILSTRWMRGSTSSSARCSLAGPHAQEESKALIRAVRGGPIDDTMIADTAARIARVRGSEEGKEGVAAFLGKRSPAWVPPPLRKAMTYALSTFDTWQLVALAAALGWASGIRLYAVLFIVGGLGYLGVVELPGGLAVLAHPWVLAASGFMFCVEFFADKIPGVDTLWDTVHTFIRIPAGAALAASVFGDSTAAATLAAAILGGSLAAGSHFAKAGSRAVINTSPEPFSNWAASFGEDLAVGTVLWLAFMHPIAALAVLAALIAFMIWLIPKIWRFIRRLFGKLSGAPGAPIR